MGFFKDLRQLQKTGKDLQRQSGMPSGLAGVKHAVSQANTMLGGIQQGNADADRLLATGIVATGIVTRLQIGSYQPGMPVPLRVDPMDVNSVLIVIPA